MEDEKDEYYRYIGLQVSQQRFDEIRKAQLYTKCPIHKKRVKMELDWTGEYDLHITISKYCCKDFAAEMAKPFIEAEAFNSVEIVEPIT